MKRKTLFLAAVPFLVLNGFFVANMTRYAELRKFADRPELAIVSAIFVVLFALPSFLATLRWLGLRRGFFALASLGLFAFFIETVALNTGVPYGAFSYGDKIGAKLPGGVPWTVAFAWAPLILGAYFLAHRVLLSRVLAAHQKSAQLRSRFVVPLAAILVTIFDGVLDPGAVSQGFWTYRNPGVYYGVPWSNYFGWLLSGIVGAAILHAIAKSANAQHANASDVVADGVIAPAEAARSAMSSDSAAAGGTVEKVKTPPSILLGSAWLILTFWTSIAWFSAMWIPFVLGVVLLLFIARHFLFSANAIVPASARDA